MTRRKPLAMIGLAILAPALGGAYYLFFVKCLGRTSHEAPQPYDVARYEVYSAVLDDVAGKTLLIQNDTRPLPYDVRKERYSSFVLRSEPGRNSTNRPTPADPEAQAWDDYGQRDSNTLPVEARLRSRTEYGFVSSEQISDLLRRTAKMDLTRCDEFKAYDAFVALSPVGFSADQTTAAVLANVWRGSCFSEGISHTKTLRKRCGKWKVVSDIPVIFDRF